MKKRKCVRRLDNPIVHSLSSCKSNIQIVYLMANLDNEFVIQDTNVSQNLNFFMNGL